ncbi:MAG TPA: LysM domain-containing protein [Chitinophagales bacterium]|nr:LysM domain-containing protein [Chitinophagales bacterium]
MRIITVKDNQSLLDIAIQEYGTVDNMIAISQANDLSVSSQLEPGQELIIPDNVKDEKTLRYYKENSIIVSTAEIPLEIEEIVLVDDSGEASPPTWLPPFSEEF